MRDIKNHLEEASGTMVAATSRLVAPLRIRIRATSLRPGERVRGQRPAPSAPGPRPPARRPAPAPLPRPNFGGLGD